MVWLVWAGIGGLLILLAIVLILRRLLNWGGAVQEERARESFRLQRERLEDHFLPAAAASGKPRGLRWVKCDFAQEVAFARDRATNQLIALVSMTVQFEAVEGGDMEGLPAVGNLRNASAVFYFIRGQWLTSGKAVFNMNPGEALLHFHNQYQPISALCPSPGPTVR